jgi:hypothetical protein
MSVSSTELYAGGKSLQHSGVGAGGGQLFQTVRGCKSSERVLCSAPEGGRTICEVFPMIYEFQGASQWLSSGGETLEKLYHPCRVSEKFSSRVAGRW